jgi:Arc/MetJ family transcription regulator
MVCMKKKPTIYEEADKQFQAAQSRTNIIMEEPLVAEAQAITGIKTKTGVVHHALRELVRRQKMKEVLEMRGKVEFWDGYEAAHVNP